MLLDQFSWRDKVNLAVGYCLLKTGRLQYDMFTEQELNDLIAPHFPFTEQLDIPIGEGHLTCLEGELTMPVATNRLTLQMLCAIDIKVMGNTIYKAHIAAGVSALPNYFSASQTLHITDTQVDFIHLLNGRYSLVKDTRFLIERLLPRPVSGLSSLLSQPLRSALNVVSAGSTDQALDYLSLYLHGGTERILEYHKPRIVNELLTKLDERAFEYPMRDDHWREFLFARWGQRVCVEDNELRFYFTPE
ncbi:DUF1439 domain-containing protein [Alteromonas gilva]|uniref:DUF1439 domain-containing protein n=1 Tax=Alteromonas gilva TaxID=2987522 RepID=A0ABT5L2B8_9ALTE|nr:DUF1439 domain-containing protein [Alteromonas gilva]MDC8830621.1 DUF1439 domain-containing protein [Alteromonas gilva]